MMKIKKNLMWLLILALAAWSCNSQNSKNGSSETADSTVVALPVSNVRHPDWSKNANIYEVNLRQYTSQGTITAFAEHLPRLKEMGVDILWMMPVQPIGEKNRKGTLGSYYSVRDYKAINPEFGAMEDFKTMVRQAHELGMKVIIDWVANHTAWDHAWVDAYPEFYDIDSTGSMYAPFGWEDVVQLDYVNDALRDAMIGEMKFWIEEADIDGYRCDVAGMVPTDFWDRARRELDEIKPVFMLAEAEKTELLIDAFDMDYGWHFHYLSNLFARGDTSAAVIAAYFDNLAGTFPQGAYKMNFTTNHDENSWNGTVHERYGEGFKTFAVLMATVPGMPLVYSGQEAGLDKRLEFFEKDPINWKNYPLKDFYKTLLDLKHSNQALWNGDFGGKYVPVKTDNEAVVAFTRTKNDHSVLVILNISAQPHDVTLQGDAYAGDYNDVFGNKKITMRDNHQLRLEAWEYRVYDANAGGL
ncbi:MAG: alpha-amylase family glycosyl hydrolase [Bacteroidales bacterium]|nr:alpha-amylase family glycosyl hydrolase [Bacteroidales bacterium]MDD4740463.1 alpha-amylase family glycosyl hydrolase [Bacteroidales bacterium]